MSVSSILERLGLVSQNRVVHIQFSNQSLNQQVFLGGPKYSGDFKIKISGGIYGSGDGKFTKEYTYKVNSK